MDLYGIIHGIKNMLETHNIFVCINQYFGEMLSRILQTICGIFSFIYLNTEWNSPKQQRQRWQELNATTQNERKKERKTCTKTKWNHINLACGLFMGLFQCLFVEDLSLAFLIIYSKCGLNFRTSQIINVYIFVASIRSLITE